MCFSEQKRQLKAQQKAEEKAQKPVAAQKNPTSTRQNGTDIGGETDDQEIDPNVIILC